MDGGWFSRHLARLRAAYRARRDALVAALGRELAAVPHTVRGLSLIHISRGLPFRTRRKKRCKALPVFRKNFWI